MYRTKKDVDKHVESLSSKLSAKEFKTRAYSIARLYFDVGDYVSCQKYVEQYLTQKDNNAAAQKLLAQALQKLGQKEKALEHFKTSLDIDPTQTSTILEICELLADDEVTIDPGRAKYWCEKAEATFPKHPVIFRLRERLLTISNPDPEALINLLKSELAIRPRDVLLHARLLKHFLQTNQLQKAFDHCCNVEFGQNKFHNSYIWYENLSEIVKKDVNKSKDWLYQLLLLTVRERICMLSLTETPSGSSQSLIESCELLHAYDQAIQTVVKGGSPPGFGEFFSSLLHHHKGQFSLHAATYLLKKAKKDQLSWRDAALFVGPLMLIAWQTVPLDVNVKWLQLATEKQQIAFHRWYIEGSFRCSQAGHYLLSNMQEKGQAFLDKISQCCVGTHWKDKLYEILFSSKDYLAKIKSSYLVSNEFTAPVLRLPRAAEVEAYDSIAQKEYPNSLHHFIWMLLNYKNYANFKLDIFEMLTGSSSNCGPETLNKLDLYAFLYCAALSNSSSKHSTMYISPDKPSVLPTCITDLLCSLTQMKWWDCAYKFTQNELGTELTDIRVTLTRGIEVVRCVDSHGLDPELLCILAKIFNEKAQLSPSTDEKKMFGERAVIYYLSAIPLLEKLQNKTVIKIPEKRMFDYTHRDLSLKDINSLIQESKLYVAIKYYNDADYEKAIDLLNNIKSPQAFYQLSKIYKTISLEEQKIPNRHSSDSKYALLSKAKTYAYKALSDIKDSSIGTSDPLYTEIQNLIEEVEMNINKVDRDGSEDLNDVDLKYHDVNMSSVLEPKSNRNNYHPIRELSSTPKHLPNTNTTNYRSAVDTHVLEVTHMDQQYLERIESQMKALKRLTDSFMDQTKSYFEENRALGNQIMNTLQTDIQNTNDQFKLLKISVDQIKDQIDECKNDCKDVDDLKKQVADLKKEVNKLKKASSEQTIDESDLYNLDDEYRTSESASNFANQMPFQPTVLPPYNQRFIPPFPIPSNPYQLYNQNLYSLYNQYSQLTQSPAVPGATPMFDSSRAPINYAGVYPTPDQMYLDAAHLVPPAVPAAPNIPAVPIIPPAVPTLPSVSIVPPVVSQTSVSSTAKTTAKTTNTGKDSSKPLPVNVVITSSDPLPTFTSAPAPVLSVTIPPKHIKGTTPHNYQIPMPSTTETKVMSPPVFNFPSSGHTTTTSTQHSWSQNTPFKSSQSMNTTLSSSNKAESLFLSTKSNDAQISKTEVDGFGVSPNTSLNKSRTLSEKSNTSIENYDPCPDFKPIVPLPAEVKVTTGEENESVIFSSRAKLFRFVDKQWKERGIGEMKLLQHKITGKVRVLMRREQVHKICANHIITPEMEIKPMKNENKAYFWVANDFADETVILEKFCIRFKTADIAQQFYEIFEKSRQESSNTSSITESKDKKTEEKADKTATPVKSSTFDSSKPKTEFGGFKFTSTPTFKAASDDNKVFNKPLETVAPKLNVFSNLNFKTTNSSPLSNIFLQHTSTNQQNSSPQQTSESKTSEVNTSDVVEEFEPNVEFKPVVPLPALVDQKTGEEDEIVLFEHRAKLLRFDAASKEWKERGIGNIKLLVHNDNVQKVRLLMRREQIMKVCCNHALTKEMIFQKMPKVDKAVTWCAKDYSDGELIAETFCLRFKNVQACDDFMQAVKNAQSKMKDDSKAAKEEQNAAKQVGFGDRFKPKPGAWQCDACYTNNLENFSKCACCEQPKPTGADNAVTSKPNTDAPVASLGWGDKFKPKAGTWECKCCFVRNEGNLDKCSACSNPKDDTQSSKDNKSNFVSVTPGPKFNFGIPPSVQTSQIQTPKTSLPTTQSQTSKMETTSSIFDGTGTHKFNFGIPATNKDKVVSFGDQKQPVFSVTKNTTSSESPINLTAKPGSADTSAPKSALLPTPQKETVFGSKETASFDFVFKPKTPQQKGKSPLKSPKSQKGDESDDNEYASEDEGHHIHFSPVIPMPDKVDVVTGEEDEVELYAHRAKLYRFISGEWKERGIGIVKILKHKQTDKLRVVMRREQVLKICLNHALTPEIMYTPKDDKTWLFAANDYSEGELSLQQFCLRFKTKEVATDFKKAIEGARQGISIANKNKPEENDSEDVVFLNEIQASNEDKLKAKQLMLPENFFTYKDKQPCQGCRGCNDDYDDNAKPIVEVPLEMKSDREIKLKATIASTNIQHTPAKSSTSTMQSPSNSIYGTPASPANFTKNLDNSVFRTPLGSIFSNTNSASPSSLITTISETDMKNKENNILANDSFDQTKESISQNETLTKSESSNSQTNTKSYILAAPKLSTFNAAGSANQKPETTSIFGSGLSKPVFGEGDSKHIFGKSAFDTTGSLFGNTNSGFSTNTSIFEGSTQNKIEESPKAEVKSIFGSDEKPVNLFSSTVQSNFFGPGSLKTNIFGSKTPTNNSESPKKDTLNQKLENKQPSGTIGKVASENVDNKDTPFKVDNTLSFAALSSGGPGFEAKKNPNFQWEGAGQQLFANAQKTASKDNDKSQNESGAGEEVEAAGGEEEYDPHYEPIVPLPDKIIVTTGEEDEEKLFGERCKLYRYDDKTKEWKERGVGEMKILYHPERNTYRFLLRREQVYKAVLNMLLFIDLELLPMKNSDRAWFWAGRNFAENPQGEQETLAARFKTVELATNFHDKVVACVRKLQANAAQSVRNEKEAEKTSTVAPLRLPKHLEVSARADAAISEKTEEQTHIATLSQPMGGCSGASSIVPSDVFRQAAVSTVPSDMFKQGGLTTLPSDMFKQGGLTTVPSDMFKQDQQRETGQEDYDEEEEEYGHDYDNEDYDAYYNEEEDESATYYTCDGEVMVEQGVNKISCENAHLQVLYDQEVYSPKILVTDNDTGEILADMLIHTDTEFQMSGDTCTWSGTDYTSNDPVDKTVTVTFADEDTAMMFFDSCETSKTATYSSTDPES